MESIELVEPTPELKREFVAMAQEWRAAGDDRVPQTTYWLVSEAQHLLGVSKLRHWLLPHLEKRGGHIGYAIRPSQRCKGYGTAILQLTLEKARKLGLKKALVTCDAQNIASIRIIEKNGSKLAETSLPEETGRPEKCYWIDLS